MTSVEVSFYPPLSFSVDVLMCINMIEYTCRRSVLDKLTTEGRALLSSWFKRKLMYRKWLMPIEGSSLYPFLCFGYVSLMELLFLLTCKSYLKVLGLVFLLSRSLSFICVHMNILFILLKDSWKECIHAHLFCLEGKSHECINDVTVHRGTVKNWKTSSECAGIWLEKNNICKIKMELAKGVKS